LQSASDTCRELKTLLHIILDRGQIGGETQKAAQRNAHLICLNFAFVFLAKRNTATFLQTISFNGQTNCKQVEPVLRQDLFSLAPDCPVEVEGHPGLDSGGNCMEKVKPKLPCSRLCVIENLIFISQLVNQSFNAVDNTLPLHIHHTPRGS